MPECHPGPRIVNDFLCGHQAIMIISGVSAASLGMIRNKTKV
jgi:hypothetical protein